MAVKNKSNEIHITRVYDAPVQAVWDAWTDPVQVAQWWGPRGFTITTHHKDLRVGGSWRYTMHGPDGTDYLNTTQYFVVEPNAKLVYDHGGHEDRPPLFRVTVLFSEANGETTLDMRMTLPTPEAAEETRAVIKKAGGNSTWDRLAEYLEKMATDKETFVISRSFDAPIEVLYDMWTDPTHFEQWLPPIGMTMQFIRADIKTGGRSFFKMTGNDGTMYGSLEYLELRRPDLVVYLQQFRDEHDTVARYPGAPTWPETMLTVVTLAAEDTDRARVTVTWQPYGETTREEIDAFVIERSGMTQGWTGSFDKLDEYLSREASLRS